MKLAQILVIDPEYLTGQALTQLINHHTPFLAHCCRFDMQTLHTIDQIRPHIVLVNIHDLAIDQPLDLSQAILQHQHKCSVLVLAPDSVLRTTLLQSSAFLAGIDGVLNRSQLNMIDLYHALEKVIAGQQLWDTRQMQHILIEHKEQQSYEQGAEALTQREREVMELVVDGLSNRIIAKQLQISERTAQKHVSNILMKLGLLSRSQIIASYYQSAPTALAMAR